MADGPDCTCGGRIPESRRDGFCSSWCRTRDAQGLPPATPPPLLPPRAPRGPSLATVQGSPGPADTVMGQPRDPAATVGGHLPAGPASDEPTRPRYRARRRLIADEIEGRLRAAGMLDHWQAATVLDLADSLDWAGGSGSARAGLHRELTRQMAEILRGQDDEGSALGGYRDELAARRAKRAGGTG